MGEFPSLAGESPTPYIYRGIPPARQLSKDPFGKGGFNRDAQKVLRSMVEGHKDSGIHSRSAKLRCNVTGPDKAKVLEGAVKTMSAGLPQFDDLLDSDHKDDVSKHGKNKNNRKAEKDPVTPEEWVDRKSVV